MHVGPVRARQRSTTRMCESGMLTPSGSGPDFRITPDHPPPTVEASRSDPGQGTTVTPWSSKATPHGCSRGGGTRDHAIHHEELPDGRGHSVFHVGAQVRGLGDPALEGRSRRRRGGEPERLGPHGHLHPPRHSAPVRQVQLDAPTRTWPATPFRAVSSASTRFESPTKSGHEEAHRRLVELARRAALGDGGVVHHDDAIGDRERLLLIVRHVRHREAEALLELADRPRGHVGGAWRRGSTAARRSRAPRAPARAPAQRRPAAAGRPRAPRAAARRTPRGRPRPASPAPARGRGPRRPAHASARRRRSRARSCAGRARRTGTPC